MIVVRLHGGLGNQMFQYAMGRALVNASRARVVFETTSFASDPQRDYALDAWRVDTPWIDPVDHPRLAKRFGGLGRTGWLHGVRPLRKVAERPFGYHPRYLQARDNSHLIGYWQDERFFASVADEVREAFTPARQVSDETARVVERVEAINSVAVHVRRTDYLRWPEMQVCDPGYQRRCVLSLLAEEPGLEAFVFSDDLPWCREHLGLPCPTHYVGHTPRDAAHEDLWMMSRCRHHVIPNSSFSWWAAWLKRDPSGETFAPTPWFNDPKQPGEGVPSKSWRLVPGRAAQRAAA